MIANSATEHSWPKTAAGTVDWEYVFEDPGTGLLGLVGQAASPAALRECAILIIAKLYARKDDPAEVERFTKEISALIPDDMAADNLAEINTVVIGLLRQIKDSRIQKAAEHEAMRAAAETEEGAGRRAGDNAKSGRSTGKDRRKPDPMTTSPPSSARAKKPNRNVLYAALTAAAVAVVITFVVLEILEPPPEETQVEILIRQIQ